MTTPTPGIKRHVDLSTCVGKLDEDKDIDVECLFGMAHIVECHPDVRKRCEYEICVLLNEDENIPDHSPFVLVTTLPNASYEFSLRKCSRTLKCFLRHRKNVYIYVKNITISFDEKNGNIYYHILFLIPNDITITPHQLTSHSKMAQELPPENVPTHVSVGKRVVCLMCVAFLLCLFVILYDGACEQIGNSTRTVQCVVVAGWIEMMNAAYAMVLLFVHYTYQGVLYRLW